MGAILLAIKMHDDIMFDSAHYSKVSGLLLQELMIVETEVLKIINNELWIDEDTYKKYYERLSSKSKEAEEEKTETADARI